MNEELVLTLLPDPKDPRDYIYECDIRDKVPSNIDLRSLTTDIEDQSVLGACTGNSIANACEMFLERAGKFNHLSRLFNYWNSRQAQPTLVGQDKGAVLRDAIRSAAKQGLPLESSWPYDVKKYNDKPSDAVFTEALQRTVGTYYRIQYEYTATTGERMVYQMKHALASGFPIVIGMTVGSDIRTIGDKIYGPLSNTNVAIGGHAMNVVGYVDDPKDPSLTGYFIVENSWGPKFGVNGFFKMSYLAVRTHMRDIWVIKGFAGESLCGPNLIKKANIRYDVEGVAGQAYRLYQAALNRVPEITGLSGWIKLIDEGMTLETAANGFIGSQEFINKYGSNPTNAEFVTNLYRNALHREPESAGLNGWIQLLESGSLNRAQVLLGFSESTENKANTYPATQNGIEIL